VRHAGGIRSANADISNDKAGEKFYYKCTQILRFFLVEYSSRGSNKKVYEVLVSENH